MRLIQRSLLPLAALVLIACGASGQDQKPLQEENFFTASLHYTNKGIQYLYSKEQGGLERLTGLSAEQAGCVKSQCHVTSCDACHRKDSLGRASYSLEPALAQQACDKCHGPISKDDPDVHYRKGMKCMDCHSPREIHGDGIAHNSYTEAGVLETRCEKCHGSIAKTASHTVHKGKLDCSVCHTLEGVTCLNCHIESRLKGTKGGQIQLKNMFLLVNHNGRVKLANMLSYVYQKKTMITFAPTFSHSIKKEGRKCGECHDSRIVKDIKNESFRAVRWENGAMKNVEGVIPVLEGMDWKLVYLDRTDTTWIPLENPPAPLLNYSGSCQPITHEQFAKLSIPRGSH